MSTRRGRMVAALAVGLGFAAACCIPALAGWWDWFGALLAGTAAAAVGGPPLMVLVAIRILPGGTPAKTVLGAVGGGLLGAVLLAGFGRGDLLFTVLGTLAGLLLVAPLYLGVIPWVLVGWIRSDGERLRRARGAVLASVVLGLLTWAVPAGIALNALDVRRAKAFVERLASAVEEEKARTGRYPPHEEIREFARGVGSPPSLLSGGFHYWAGGNRFEIGFQDRTELFGGYDFRGPDGGWDHWVD